MGVVPSVRISSIARTKVGQSLEQALRLWQRDTQILIRPQREKRGVRIAMESVRREGITTISATIRFQTPQDLARRDVREIARDGGPASCKAGKMDEVEAPAISEPFEVRRDGSQGSGLLKSDEPFQPEDRVIKIAVAGTVLEPAIGIQAAVQERGDQIAGLTELLRRQPRHLQHFEPQTHCTIPGSRR